MSPLARLHHFLHRQGVALETPMAIISDGGEEEDRYLDSTPVRAPSRKPFVVEPVVSKVGAEIGASRR